MSVVTQVLGLDPRPAGFRPAVPGRMPERRSVVRNPVEAAYARSDLFEERRLMDEGAAYLDGEHGSDHETRP